MSMQWMPQINQSICIGCTECVKACPVGALVTKDEKATLLHPELCTYCAACEAICPVEAIELPYLIVKADHPEELNNVQ